jgi:transketolase
MSDVRELAINTLRFLAIDEVEKANSGHPGAPLGDAPMAYLLFHDLMRHNPKNSNWTNRDRFVLSNGHASAMLYAVLHLSGYKLTIDDLKGFRQWGSKTPGHPEIHEADGVEATTGPLGQGFAMAVGMAIAEKHLAAVYNRPDFAIVDHYTYGICGDGDLMEGISHEAASLAGTLALGKLIFFYDDNLISLDGPTDLSFTENVQERFEAYGWDTHRVADGNDLAALAAAVKAAQNVKDRPSLISVRTIIGYGSPRAGTKDAHGEALGPERTKQTKEALHFPTEPAFFVPEEAQKHWDEVPVKGQKLEQEWNDLFAKYKAAFPAEAAEYERVFDKKGILPKDWDKDLPTYKPDAKPMATRSAGGEVLNYIGKHVPEVMGGAADLTSSTKTIFKDSKNFHLDPAGKNIFFGVREFGMCAAVNGMAVHGGIIPFGSTFFTFSDYARSALRMAALMKSHSIFVFTHDSIGLGEDGPTHQPIEHLTILRATPGLTDFRPADANETAACWKLALERKTPSFFALSRQDLPIMDAEKYSILDNTAKGAYILEKGGDAPDVLLVATGSEVSLIVESAKKLEAEGVKTRTVSMPSQKIFEEQSAEYKASVFPDALPVLAVEAGATLGWWKYAGRHGDVIGIDKFGASAPAKTIFEHYGFTTENVAAHAKKLVAARAAVANQVKAAK